MKTEYRPIIESDFEKIKKIYDYYILHTTATFHTQPIELEELKQWIPVNQLKYPSFLIYQENTLAGYCYVSPYKNRQAYDRTAELTLYLDPDRRGRGIGKETVSFLEYLSRENGIKVLIGGITAENIPSVKLFEKCGFSKCAHLKQVGEKFGKILDVVYYQKILNETE